MSYFNVDISKCMCCYDSKKFKNMVYESNNIKNKIETFIKLHKILVPDIEFRNWNRENSSKLYIMYNDKKYPHFMCGYCHQVNLDELTIAESSLRNTISKVFFIVQCETESIETKKVLVNYVLNLLAGNYPITYKSLNKFATSHINKD